MTAAPPENFEIAPLPENLPPVEPPSAKFIVQLFVVPGLIVAAIIGAWWMFGKLASSELDWQKLVQDLRSGNEHRRGRAAYGLATALATEQRSANDGPRMANNPQVAEALAKYLSESLTGSVQDAAKVEEQKYLVAAVGMLDVTEVILPVLREAMQPQRDREVRFFAVRSVANIASRAAERGTPLSNQILLADLQTTGTDAEALLRATTAFTLGFLSLDLTRQPLTVLLADSDLNTCVNAAIAFARHKSLDGLPVLREVLIRAAATKTPAPSGDSAPIATTNALKAVGELAPLIDSDTRAAIQKDIETISRTYPEARVRLDAAQVLANLRGK